jgi:hypothetical protein
MDSVIMGFNLHTTDIHILIILTIYIIYELVWWSCQTNSDMSKLLNRHLKKKLLNRKNISCQQKPLTLKKKSLHVPLEVDFRFHRPLPLEVVL